MSEWTNRLLLALGSNSDIVKNLNQEKSFTYKHLLNAAVCFGKKLNLPKQSIVSVVLPNSFEYLITYLACSLYGYIYAPLPYFLNAAEVEKALAYHKSVIVITDRTDFQTDILTLDPNIIILDTDFLQSFNSAELPPIDDGDIISLYHSSGTTGNPKGVLYSHSNKYNLIKSIVEDFSFSDKEKHLRA